MDSRINAPKSLVGLLHRDERRRSELGNDFHVVFACISLVGGNLVQYEVLRGCCCQSWRQFAIAKVRERLELLRRLLALEGKNVDSESPRQKSA